MKSVYLLVAGFLLLSGSTQAGQLLLDPHQTGAPDLLSGPDTWAKPGSSARASLLNYRALKLDPNGWLFWEWVGPSAGLLVVSKNGKPPVGLIGGDQIVGTFMGAHRWASSYQALAYFDKDRDKRVSGREFDPLYSWTDSNGDALVDPPELTPAAKVYTSLSTDPSQAEGALWAEGGAIQPGGARSSTWDWQPSARLPLLDAAGNPIPIVVPVYLSPSEAAAMPAPVVYQWVQPLMKAVGLYRFFPVGDSLWVATLGPDFGRTGVVSVGEVFIDRSQPPITRVSWSVSDGGDNWSRVEATLSAAGVLEGKASYNGEASPLLALQVKPPFSFNPAVSSILALPDVAFQQAVLGNFPRRLLVPFGIRFNGFSRDRGLLDLAAH